MPKEAYLPTLFSLFQQQGYDGATLAKISAATGLGKASLYHHFPGGKDDMVKALLATTEQWLTQNILSVLDSSGEPRDRLKRMCDHVNDLYDGGKNPCLLAALQVGPAHDLFHDSVKAVLAKWIEAIARVLTEAGLDDAIARQRSEDAIAAIQGSLVLSQALDDPSPFQRVIQQLPQNLCASIPDPST